MNNASLEDLSCGGCGMEDPCGVHYDDCTLLEEGDWVVARGFTGYREDAARLWEGAPS